MDGFIWSPDAGASSSRPERSGKPHAIQVIPVRAAAPRRSSSGDSVLDDMQLTRDGKTMVFTQQRGVRPMEIYRATSAAAPRYR